MKRVISPEYTFISTPLGPGPKTKLELRHIKRAIEHSQPVIYVVEHKYFDTEPCVSASVGLRKERLAAEERLQEMLVSLITNNSKENNKRYRKQKLYMDTLKPSQFVYPKLFSSELPEKNLKLMWPLQLSHPGYSNHIQSKIRDPAKTIVHIENSLFQVFYVIRDYPTAERIDKEDNDSCKNVYFKTRTVCNKSYLAHKKITKEKTDKVYVDDLYLPYDAEKIFETATEMSDEVCTAKARKKFNLRFPDNEPEEFEWIVNYELQGFQYLRTNICLEYLILMAYSLPDRKRVRAFHRIFNFLVYMNCHSPCPKITPTPRTRNKPKKNADMDDTI